MKIFKPLNAFRKFCAKWGRVATGDLKDLPYLGEEKGFLVNNVLTMQCTFKSFLKSLLYNSSNYVHAAVVSNV